MSSETPKAELNIPDEAWELLIQDTQRGVEIAVAAELERLVAMLDDRAKEAAARSGVYNEGKSDGIGDAALYLYRRASELRGEA